jgi:outer membrane protein TolC
VARNPAEKNVIRRWDRHRQKLEGKEKRSPISLDCEDRMRLAHGSCLQIVVLALLLPPQEGFGQRKDDTPLPPKFVEPSFAPPPSLLDAQTTPIDLPSALRLAAVANPELLLARERISEAVAERQLAAAQFLPTLHAGTNFDNHTGTLQRSTGVIEKVNRGSLYVGLGANAVGAGTVNIPGVVFNANLSEAYFNVLVRRQIVQAREFSSIAVQNDVLLRVANGYLELLRATAHRAIAVQNREEAQKTARLTANYAKVKQGRPADADRAATVLEERNAELLQAESDLLTASARLAQLLNLDPAIRLEPTDSWAVPSPIVPDPIPVAELIAVALTQRPELRERQAVIRAALLQLRSAKLLPFSPDLIVGYSAATFGGGSNLAAAGIRQADGTILRQPRFDSFDDRQDLDVVAFWTLRNLGVGNVALIRLAQSNLRSERLREVEVLDRVRAEVAIAYARAHARFAQIERAERAVQSSQNAYTEDYTRTFQHQGLVIEVLDSLRLLARSRYAYLDAIIDYNRAQFELYVALGQPPADTLARPVPSELVPAPVMAK